MTWNFALAYDEGRNGAVTSKLHPSNGYYGKYGGSNKKVPGKGPSDLLPSSTGPSTGPQFEELELGTTYSALRNLVVKSVTSSVSRTAAYLTLAKKTGVRDSAGQGKPPIFNALGSIKEGSLPSPAKILVDAELETGPPKWDTIGWLSETIPMVCFCPDMAVHSAGTLKDMMSSDDNITMGVMEITICTRPRPFAQGAMRVASYARTAASRNRVVAKSFKETGHGIEEMAEDMRIQALCKVCALEFNGLLKTAHPINFIVTMALQRKSKVAMAAREGCLSLEPFIDGDYVKYNSNAGWVSPSEDPMNMTAQAFSHFTFERFFGHFLISDLQGVGHVLTDPSIQTADPQRFKLNETNLHEEGFKFFFATHECNNICRQPGLKSNRQMMASGSFQFRERWPTMDPTVCCSDKLCQQIVRLSVAREAPEFPGYHWCQECWPQLRNSVTDWVCMGPGPTHEYVLSRFFYESQGKIAPRKCPKHLEKDINVSSADLVGAGLWSWMKDADVRGAEVSGRDWLGGLVWGLMNHNFGWYLLVLPD